MQCIVVKCENMWQLKSCSWIQIMLLLACCARSTAKVNNSNRQLWGKLYHNYNIQTWSQVKYVLKGLNENIKTVASFHGLSLLFLCGQLVLFFFLVVHVQPLEVFIFDFFSGTVQCVSKLFLGNNALIHVSYLALTFTGKVICVVFICITKLFELCGKYVELPFLELLVVNYIRLVAIYIG